jgi:hypothetical protein
MYPQGHLGLPLNVDQVCVVQIHTDYARVNVSHHIHHFYFGSHYHGRLNALDNFDRTVDHDYGTFRYFLTVVPVTCISSFWRRASSYTYSVSEYFLPGSAHAKPKPGEVNAEVMPALEFTLRMSPLAMTVSYPARRPGQFLVRLCAVLGGCFALTRFADKVASWVCGALNLSQ